MVSSLEIRIREKLVQYLVQELSIDEFEDWIVQHTWNVHQVDSGTVQDLASAIEARLAEYSGGHITEESLRNQLRPLAQQYVMMIGPQSPSASSSSEIMFRAADLGQSGQSFGIGLSTVSV